MDLGVKLNPLTKLRLFHTVRDYIFSQMDRKTITPERADEILGYVKKYVQTLRLPSVQSNFIFILVGNFQNFKLSPTNSNWKKKKK